MVSDNHTHVHMNIVHIYLVTWCLMPNQIQSTIHQVKSISHTAMFMTHIILCWMWTEWNTKAESGQNSWQLVKHAKLCSNLLQAFTEGSWFQAEGTFTSISVPTHCITHKLGQIHTDRDIPTGSDTCKDQQKQDQTTPTHPPMGSDHHTHTPVSYTHLTLPTRLSV